MRHRIYFTAGGLCFLVESEARPSRALVRLLSGFRTVGVQRAYMHIDLVSNNRVSEDRPRKSISPEPLLLGWGLHRVVVGIDEESERSLVDGIGEDQPEKPASEKGDEGGFRDICRVIGDS